MKNMFIALILALALPPSASAADCLWVPDSIVAGMTTNPKTTDVFSMNEAATDEAVGSNWDALNQSSSGFLPWNAMGDALKLRVREMVSQALNLRDRDRESAIKVGRRSATLAILNELDMRSKNLRDSAKGHNIGLTLVHKADVLDAVARDIRAGVLDSRFDASQDIPVETQLRLAVGEAKATVYDQVNQAGKTLLKDLDQRLSAAVSHGDKRAACSITGGCVAVRTLLHELRHQWSKTMEAQVAAKPQRREFQIGNIQVIVEDPAVDEPTLAGFLDKILDSMVANALSFDESPRTSEV